MTVSSPAADAALVFRQHHESYSADGAEASDSKKIAYDPGRAQERAGLTEPDSGRGPRRSDRLELTSTGSPRGSESAPGEERAANGRELTPEQKRQVEELRKRDREVRQHEAAHKAAAGQYARGSATFTYQTGPDGKRYAVGGEVSVDMSPVPGNPEATVRKMETVRRAALAPKDPSPNDRAAAAQASRRASEARRQMNQEESDSQGSTAAGTAKSVNPASPEAAGNVSSTYPTSDASKPAPVDGHSASRQPVLNGTHPLYTVSGADPVGRLFDLTA